MLEEYKEKLKEICGNIHFGVPVSRYTTFKVGGKVWAVCDVRERNILYRLLGFLSEKGISYMILGGGSKLLVSDSGFKGVMIRLKGEFERIEIQEGKDLLLKVGAGTPIYKLIDFCVKNRISGLEFLVGIPGTAGGAVVMNAGAFGEEIGGKVRKVSIVNSKGESFIKKREKLRFSYRYADIKKDEVITDIWIDGICFSEKGLIKEKIETYMYIRKKRQPLEFPNAGCIFKNPDKIKAGRVIEEIGLKGKKIGGAMVSEKHANFIINTGNAKAKDIFELIQFIKKEVKEKRGIELEEEIKIVGF